MTPDMKRLCEAAGNVFLNSRLDYLEHSEAEAIVRAVLTELRDGCLSAKEAAARELDDPHGFGPVSPIDIICHTGGVIEYILAEPATA